MREIKDYYRGEQAMNLKKECYEVGALLYAPALNDTVVKSIINEKFGNRYSMAFCLEDTVSDDAVEVAEKQLVDTLKRIYCASKTKDFYLPKIFIRVREPEQILRLMYLLKDSTDILTGFIFPKYSLDNAGDYNDVVKKINMSNSKLYYMMPILESRDIIDYATRKEILLKIKEYIDDVKEYVLNIRVGGNDFSNEFAARRHYDESIYDIKPIANLLGDILTVFAREYILSGPVWEFFSSDNNEWKEGLIKELALDRLNGFVGKTVIHPKQIDVVNDALKVSRKDYEDAKAILEWDENNSMCVSKSSGGERMNELKTHGNWAAKTLVLAEVYGIN